MCKELPVTGLTKELFVVVVDFEVEDDAEADPI